MSKELGRSTSYLDIVVDRIESNEEADNVSNQIENNDQNAILPFEREEFSALYEDDFLGIEDLIDIQVEDDHNSLNDEEKLAYLNDVTLDLSDEPKSSATLDRAITWDGGYGTKKIHQNKEFEEEKKHIADPLGIIEKSTFTKTLLTSKGSFIRNP